MLSSEEQSIFCRDDSIVIKSADKGLGIVVEETVSYEADGMSHLSDTTIYSPIEEDPTAQLGLAINKFVDRLYSKGVIDDITKRFLTFDEAPRTQLLYFLKKIHKHPIAVRPIVSSCLLKGSLVSLTT